MSEAEPRKVLHILRRFVPSRNRAAELTLVVFGVLVALGLENFVQEQRWKMEARELEALARKEFEVNLAEAIERVAVDRCLRNRVEFLASGLVQRSDAYAPQPMRTAASTAKPALPRAYQPLLRPWRSAAIERFLTADASKRVQPETLLGYSRVLANLESLRRDAPDEFVASGRITPLALGVPLMTEEVRATMLSELGELDRARSGVEVLSRRLIDRGLELAIAPEPQDVVKRLQNIRAAWGACVDLDAGVAIATELANRSSNVRKVHN